jgi:THO complex subunit 2
MHVYNAIIVLKEILPVFPLADVTTVGSEIEAVIDKLVETEDRSDLKILARAYVSYIAFNTTSVSYIATLVTLLV